MPMHLKPRVPPVISADELDSPIRSTWDRVMASIFIGPWSMHLSLLRGHHTREGLRCFVKGKAWRPIPLVRLTWRRYYALQEPTTASTD